MSILTAFNILTNNRRGRLVMDLSTFLATTEHGPDIERVVIWGTWNDSCFVLSSLSDFTQLSSQPSIHPLLPS